MIRKYFRYRNIAIIVAVLSTLFIALGLFAANQGDVALYQWYIHNWLAGNQPYIWHIVEYPPYALGIFWLPWLLGDANYLLNFMLLALGLDIAIKAILFKIGREQRGSEQTTEGNSRAYAPLLAYSLTVPFITYFYLQRFDLWPAFLSLLALWLFFRKKYAWSGAIIAVGAGVKAYPALFLLPLVALAWSISHVGIVEKINKFGRLLKGKYAFIIGACLGFLPLVIISFFLPWWNFAVFQGARGLQVESLYASALWLGQHLGLFGNLIWIRTTAWFEVQGPLASALVPRAKAAFVLLTAGSTLFATFAAWKIGRNKMGKNKIGENGVSAVTIGHVAKLLLIPLLAFVVFNTVFSPQYMIWILPLAAVALLQGSVWPPILIFIAAALVPIFYPTLDYFSGGLDLLQTAALFGHNLLLVIAWGWLVVRFIMI